MSWHDELRSRIVRLCSSAVPFEDLVGNRDPDLLDTLAEVLVLYAAEKGRITLTISLEDEDEAECPHGVAVS